MLCGFRLRFREDRSEVVSLRASGQCTQCILRREKSTGLQQYPVKLPDYTVNLTTTTFHQQPDG